MLFLIIGEGLEKLKKSVTYNFKGPEEYSRSETKPEFIEPSRAQALEILSCVL